METQTIECCRFSSVDPFQHFVEAGHKAGLQALKCCDVWFSSRSSLDHHLRQFHEDAEFPTVKLVLKDAESQQQDFIDTLLSVTKRICA